MYKCALVSNKLCFITTNLLICSCILSQKDRSCQRRSLLWFVTVHSSHWDLQSHFAKLQKSPYWLRHIFLINPPKNAPERRHELQRLGYRLPPHGYKACRRINAAQKLGNIFFTTEKLRKLIFEETVKCSTPLSVIINQSKRTVAILYL